MVDLVDVLVERTPVQGAVRPVMPCVFDNKEEDNLVGHLEERGERDAGCEAKVLGHWMEKPA